METAMIYVTDSQELSVYQKIKTETEVDFDTVRISEIDYVKINEKNLGRLMYYLPMDYLGRDKLQKAGEVRFSW